MQNPWKLNPWAGSFFPWMITFGSAATLCHDYDFLKPYADEAVFTESSAKCVLVGAPGQHVIAVVLEGFSYPRYCCWPFADRYELAALLKD